MFLHLPCVLPVGRSAAHLSHYPPRCHCSSVCSYGDLLAGSEKVLAQVAASLPPSNKGAADGPRVGVYAEPGPGYVAVTWATWMAGGIAVPLAVTHPLQELQYVMEDAGVCTVRTTWLARSAAAEKLPRRALSADGLLTTQHAYPRMLDHTDEVGILCCMCVLPACQRCV